MCRNEFKLKLAEIILNDWRQAFNNNPNHKGRLNLPGDPVDISYRALQKAEGMMPDFYETPNKD